MNLTPQQVGEQLGVTGQTVRNWTRWKWIAPAYINASGEPLFSQEQVNQMVAALPMPNKAEIKKWLSQFPKPDTIVEPPTMLQIIPQHGKFAPVPDPNSKVANLLSNSSVMLFESLEHPKCDLTNPKEVVRYTEEYFKFCSELSMMPSKRRLANWLGYSSSALETQIRNNTKTGQYFEMIFDAIKDNLEQAALFNNVNNISAMFILKSQHGYVEASKVIVEPSANALGTPKTPEEIAESIDNDIVE